MQITKIHAKKKLNYDEMISPENIQRIQRTPENIQ